MSHGGGGSAMGDLKWVIGILLGLWLIWFFTGGPARYESSQKGAFIKPPAPISTGEVYGPAPK